MSNGINLVEMQQHDIPDAVNLIKHAMNDDEADWANMTMNYHFGCASNHLDDGRYYYVWQNDTKVVGITGLHHYNWGPKENVWLGWFALDPDLHGMGLGHELLDQMVLLAKEKGFKKLFIETYMSPTFEKARSFYQSKGFKLAGQIENYLPDGESMVVYMKELEEAVCLIED